MKKHVDWTSQWELHTPHFRDGCAHIDLSLYGPAKRSLQLQPGAGFGDCSHPTTRLVLRLMAHRVQGRTLLDIGCGSGILSLASLLFGATRAIGVDIDEESLEHAKCNSRLNQLSGAYFASQLPDAIEDDPFIVMNMISSEQRVAWPQNASIHHLSCPVITSGILTGERGRYLEEVRQFRGWHLREELQEEEWLAFLFDQRRI